MRKLTGEEFEQAKAFFDLTAKIAGSSLCHRRLCGSIVVADGEIIGKGYNAPPDHCKLDYCFKDKLPKDFKSDKTCCTHAEQAAINDARDNYAGKLEGATIYFTSIDENGAILFSGDPYCTICSKSALEAKIAEFVLWHEDGITAYDTKEYNMLSFGLPASSQSNSKQD